MARRLLFAAWWIALLVYGFGIAPGPDPDLLALIIELGSFATEDRLSIGLFNLMGVWPFLFLAVLVDEGGLRIPPWLFAVGSFALGAFVLLPYFVLRAQPPPPAPVSGLRRLAGHRAIGIVATVAVLGLVSWSVLGADAGAFAARWQQSNFVNVMSIDFLCLCALFPLAARDDAVRRQASAPLRALLWVPLVGATLYVALRPSR